MRTIALVLTFFIGLTTSSAASAQERWKEVPNIDALNQIPTKTAWILLGLIDSNDEWATEPSFVHAKSGGHEWLGATGPVDRKTTGAHPPVVADFPSFKDQIKLTSPTRLVIVDFKSNKKNVYESPAGLLELNEKDVTGLILPQGTVVKVIGTDVGRPLGVMKPVWAKVTIP